MLIDLDQAPPSRPPSAAPAHRRPIWIIPVVMALFLGGAQVPDEIRTVRRPSVVADELAVTWTLHGDVLYSLHSRPGRGMLQLQARTIPGAEPLWTRDFDPEDAMSRLRMAGPYLAFVNGSRTMLLDVSTGQARWRDDDHSMAVAAGDEVLLWTPKGRIGLLDPVTTKIRWRREVAATPIGVTATGQHVQILYDDGTAVTYRRADGEVVDTTGNLPVRPREIDGHGGVIDDGLPTLTAAGDLAIVFGPAEITALQLPTLLPLWTAEVPRPIAASRCGDRVCVLHTGGMTALDQRTGKPLWSGAEWTTWNGTLAGGPGGRIAHVDPDTGTIIEDRGRGQLAGSMVIRAGSDRTAVFDQVSGALRATVPAALRSCTATGDQLVCQGDGGSLTVWRIPRT